MSHPGMKGRCVSISHVGEILKAHKNCNATRIIRPLLAGIQNVKECNSGLEFIAHKVR